MKYLRIENGLIDYPFELSALIVIYPSISFPSNLSSTDLLSYNVFEVNEVEKPSNENFTKVVTESAPSLINGEYYQSWLVENASQDYIDHYKNLKWNEIRSIRNRYLQESDWTQLRDAPFTENKRGEWVVYRQSLRDITKQSDPYNITWPTKPE